MRRLDHRSLVFGWLCHRQKTIAYKIHTFVAFNFPSLIFDHCCLICEALSRFAVIVLILIIETICIKPQISNTMEHHRLQNFIQFKQIEHYQVYILTLHNYLIIIVHIQMEAVSHFFSGIATNINGLATNINGNISVNITLDSTAHEKRTTVKRGRNHMILPVYTGSDDISGQIQIELTETERYDHLGLKCYLIGQLQIFGQQQLSTEFTLLCKELQPAGRLIGNKVYKFRFSHFDKQYQTFTGKAGRVRYFIRASLARNLMPPLVEQEQFAVFITEDETHMQILPTLLSVGVDDRLRIEFLLHKNCYHIKEWVEGTVKFIKIGMPISRMEISLIQRETLGTPDNTTSNSKTLQTFQVMDGCPQQGQFIPFRMCMRGVKKLTPSYKSIHNRLFVRHWFMVTIYDFQGKKYFKQGEITFYRRRQLIV